MEAILDQIRTFAENAHGSQMRKYTPERYIVHPVRVMETCRKFNLDLPSLAAALLHDVLEDTPVTADQLRSFLITVMDEAQAEETLVLVEELTDVYVKEAYPQWNRKQRKEKERQRIAMTSARSQSIKYADMIDNTREITSHDPGFAPRYLKECLDNLKVADKGNRELYELALAGIMEGLRKLQKGNRAV